jgi:hypothetical protein
VDDSGEKDEKLSKSISFTRDSITRVAETESLDGNSSKGVSICCSFKNTSDTALIIFKIK